MSAVVLLAAAAITWLLRIGFIVIVPAHHLPEQIRRSLDNAALAALAALVGTALAHGGGAAALVRFTPELLAAIAAGIVAWRTRRLGFTVVVGIAVMAAVDLAAAAL